MRPYPRKLLAALLGAVFLALLVTAGVNNVWRAQPWGDGETHGQWTAMYSGYGRTVGTDRQVVLEPKAATSSEVTHGSLVHTTETYQDADF